MKFKRVISMILCLAFLGSMLPAYAAEAETDAAAVESMSYTHTDTSGMTDIKEEGSGVTRTMYKITDYAGLQKFQALSQSSNFSGVTIYLASNITAGGTIAPVGNSRFYGTFDGNGYTISDLNVVNDDDTISMCGLFRMVGDVNNSGIVKNLTLENCNVADAVITGDNNSFVGAIAGMLMQGSIENCRVIGGNVIGGGSSESYVGGIVGTLDNGTVTACSCSTAVYGLNGAAAGGIAGMMYSGTLTYCAALNPLVEASSSASRIVNYDSGTSGNNIAWSGMRVTSGGIAVTDFSASARHGTGCSSPDLLSLIDDSPSAEAYCLPDSLPAHMSTVTPVDQDATVTVALTGGSTTMTAAGTLTFTLSVPAALDYPVAVGYRTIDGSAKAGSQYTGASGTAVIVPGTTETTVTVSVSDFTSSNSSAEDRWDGSRNFLVQFSNPENAGLACTDGQAYETGSNSVSYSVSLNRTGTYKTTVKNTGHSFEIPTTKVYGENVTDQPCAYVIMRLHLDPALIQPALEDSNASGVAFSNGIWGYTDASTDKYIIGSASLSDSSGTISYDANDYTGWPKTYNGESHTPAANSFGFWAPPLSGDTEGGSFTYAVPRSKFIAFMDLAAEDRYYKLYDMCIQDAGGSVNFIGGGAGYESFTLIDFTDPVVTGITAPTGITYRPGDVIPVTVKFSEAVTVPTTAALTVNGAPAPFAGSAASVCKYATFLYTVQDVDNAAMLSVSGSGLAGAADLIGNASDLTGNSAGLDLTSSYTVSGLTIETPLPSQAIYALESDNDDYDIGDPIEVTLTDYRQSDVSLWLRNTYDSTEGVLGGAYLAARNPESGDLDTYAFTLKNEASGDAGSCTYTAEIPASNYVSENGTTLQLALFYGSGVSQDNDGVFSGGTIAYDKLLSVDISPLVPVTGVALNTGAYPENYIIYMTSDTATQLSASISTAAQTDGSDASFSYITWSSSDSAVATIDSSGIIHPVSAGTVTFTATAENGGFSTPVSATTPEFTISAGGKPAVVIPSNANRFSTAQGEDITICWNTNLDSASTDYTIKVYEGSDVSGSPVFDQTYADGDRLSSSSLMLGGSLMQKVSEADSDYSMVPAYTFTVSAPNPDNESQTLTATGYIVVYPLPASVEFDALGSYYITDAEESVNIGWTLENMTSGSSAFALKIYKNSDTTPIYSTTDAQDGYSSYRLDIEPVADGRLRDIYTVQATATNVSGPSSDSFLLYVYDAAALSILVSDADGNDITPADGEELTLSNENYIANLYNQEGSEGILKLSRDISLQSYISINYGDHTWGVISDQIEWLSDDTAVATLNYRQGTSYEPLSAFTYTKYPPGTTLSLAGEGDGQATITATHALTGRQVSVDVSVETLEDKLYIFQFYPRQDTSVTYENSAGEEVTLTSDKNGELAVYDPNGISSDVSLRSGSGDTVYLGKIYEEKLKSGEQDNANRGLYPVNILQLRNTKLEVCLKDPAGNAWSGAVTYSGAVYKNGELCQDTIVTGGTQAVQATGLFSLNLNASKFWTESPGEALNMDDSLEFVFVLECGDSDEYYPAYISIDGNLNTQDLVKLGNNVTQLRANASGSPNPFIASQTVTSDSLLGAVDVLESTGNIGPGNCVPEETLNTTVFWWGEDADEDYGLRLESSDGAVLQSQTVHTYQLPFYDAAVTLNKTVLSDATIGAGTVLNLSPGGTCSAAVSLLREDGSLYLRKATAFNIADAVGMTDPEDSDAIEQELKDLSAVFSGENAKTFDPDSISGNTKYIMDALDALETLSTPSAMRLQVIYTATADPLVYTGLIELSPGDEGNDVSFGASIDLDILTLEGSAYVQTEIRYDSEDEDWNMSAVGGGFYLTVGMSGDSLIFQAVVLVPFPITVKMGLQAAINMSMQFLRSPVDSSKADMLFTEGLKAGITAFAGEEAKIGEIVDVKAGVSGELSLGGYFSDLALYLSTDTTEPNVPMDVFENYAAAVLNLSGEIDLKAEFNLCGAGRSISVSLASFSVNIANTGDWNEIRQWVSDNGIKDYFGIYSADEITTMAYDLYNSGHPEEATALLCAIAGGVEITTEDSGWQPESRDYLETGERSWHSSMMRLLAVNSNALTTIQSNAYSNSDPMISDDGAVMLYRSDADSTDINDMNISWASASGSGFADQGAVDTGADVLPAAGDFDFDGTGSFAAAVWTAQKKAVSFDDPDEISDSELNAVIAGTEIVASIYQGGTWSTTRLTDNSQTDMAPVVAANGRSAFVAWHSMAGSGIDGDSDDLNLNDVSDRILYRIYNGTSWGETAVLYNGSFGSVCSADAAMLSDGTTAVVYTLDMAGNGDSADYEIFCTLVDSSGKILSTLRLTNDDEADFNAQVEAVDFGGSDGEQFVVGWYHTYSDGNGDIVFAAVSGSGLLYDGFSDSVSSALAAQDIQVGSDFHFVLSEDRQLSDLSVVWSELCAPENDTEAYSSLLRAVKFCLDGSGNIYLTAPLVLAETDDETQVMSFDGWYDDTSATLNVVLLVTDYSENGTGSTICSASASYQDDISVSASVNQDEIVHDFDTSIPFTLTNLGAEVLTSASIVLSDGTTSADFGSLNLFPNQSVVLNLPYYVPSEANGIKDLNYEVTASFVGGSTETASGTLDIAIPDIGITSIEPVSAEDGLRTFRISLQNLSDVEFSGNTAGYTAHLGIYTDPEFQTPAKDSSGNNMVYEFTGTDLAMLDLDGLTKLYTYALPDTGFENGDIRLYARVWVEENSVEIDQYYQGNDTKSIVFSDPVAANGGNPISLTVEQNNSSGVTVAHVTVRNLSLTPAANGNLSVSLLDSAGNVLETLIYASGSDALISLGNEESETFSFTFSQAGYSVQASYYTVSPGSVGTGLASLKLSGITFDFDNGTDAYSLRAVNQGSTTITAAAASPQAVASVLDSSGRTLASNTAVVSYTLPLLSSGTTEVSVVIHSTDTSAVDNVYTLSITNTLSASGGIAINAGTSGTVAVTANDLSDFTPATWQFCTDGTWSSVMSWGTSNVFHVNSGSYSSIYVRVFDSDGRYMDSNVLSLNVSSYDNDESTSSASSTQAENPFTDVQSSDWFYDSVMFAYQNGLFLGTSDTTFSPNAVMTRAMLVTVLYRMVGEPAIAEQSDFSDVVAEEWYADAVSWAGVNGIVGGYGNGLFGVSDPISREQLALILYRYAAEAGYDVSTAVSLDRYTDSGNVSSYALEAMQWAVGAGLITGKSDSLLDPSGSATRAEVATILMRFVNNIAE